MEWIFIAILGLLIGAVAGLIGREFHMPPSICLAIGAGGGLVGGIFHHISGMGPLGTWSFYIAGGLVSTGLLAGGLLGYRLTTEERH